VKGYAFDRDGGAFVRRVGSGDDLDQGAFACTIFSEDGVNFAPVEIE
jgi:hypothetical protein